MFDDSESSVGDPNDFRNSPESCESIHDVDFIIFAEREGISLVDRNTWLPLWKAFCAGVEARRDNPGWDSRSTPNDD